MPTNEELERRCEDLGNRVAWLEQQAAEQTASLISLRLKVDLLSLGGLMDPLGPVTPNVQKETAGQSVSGVPAPELATSIALVAGVDTKDSALSEEKAPGEAGREEGTCCIQTQPALRRRVSGRNSVLAHWRTFDATRLPLILQEEASSTDDSCRRFPSSSSSPPAPAADGPVETKVKAEPAASTTRRRPDTSDGTRAASAYDQVDDNAEQPGLEADEPVPPSAGEGKETEQKEAEAGRQVGEQAAGSRVGGEGVGAYEPIGESSSADPLANYSLVDEAVKESGNTARGGEEEKEEEAVELVAPLTVTHYDLVTEADAPEPVSSSVSASLPRKEQQPVMRFERGLGAYDVCLEEGPVSEERQSAGQDGEEEKEMEEKEENDEHIAVATDERTGNCIRVDANLASVLSLDSAPVDGGASPAADAKSSADSRRAVFRAGPLFQQAQRDWNEEFQQLLDRRKRMTYAHNAAEESKADDGVPAAPRGKEQKKMGHSDARLLLHLCVSQLCREFTATAAALARIIVEELHVPVADKTIPPVSTSGVAGGEKFVVGRIFFKFCLDSAGLYGSDAMAMKAGSCEMRNTRAYMGLPFPGLHVPLLALVDYLGYRLSAASLLPVQESSLVYGSQDQCRTVFFQDPVCNELMKRAARHLNLAGHRVGSRRKARAGQPLMYCCGDVEGHKGKDGRLYLIDTARVFPPEAPARTLPLLFIPTDSKLPVALNPCTRARVFQSGAAVLRAAAAVPAPGAAAAAEPPAATTGAATASSPAEAPPCGVLQLLDSLVIYRKDLQPTAVPPETTGGSETTMRRGTGAELPAGSVLNVRASLLADRQIYGPVVLAPSLKGSQLFMMLRPEFVRQYVPVQSSDGKQGQQSAAGANEEQPADRRRCPLSSDAFTGFGRLDAALHNGRVRAATNQLLVLRVNDFCEAVLSRREFVYDLHSLKHRLHSWGLNVRHMGKIRAVLDSQAPLPASAQRDMHARDRCTAWEQERSFRIHVCSVFLSAMVGRLWKNRVRARWRALLQGLRDKPKPAAQVRVLLRRLVAQELNLLLGRYSSLKEGERAAGAEKRGDGQLLDGFAWNDSLKARLQLKYGLYGSALTQREMARTYDLGTTLARMPLLLYVSRSLGVRLRPETLSKAHSDASFWQSPRPFCTADIEALGSVHQPMLRADELNELLLSREETKGAETKGEGTKDERLTERGAGGTSEMLRLSQKLQLLRELHLRLSSLPSGSAEQLHRQHAASALAHWLPQFARQARALEALEIAHAAAVRGHSNRASGVPEAGTGVPSSGVKPHVIDKSALPGRQGPRERDSFSSSLWSAPSFLRAHASLAWLSSRLAEALREVEEDNRRWAGIEEAERVELKGEKECPAAKAEGKAGEDGVGARSVASAHEEGKQVSEEQGGALTAQDMARDAVRHVHLVLWRTRQTRRRQQASGRAQEDDGKQQAAEQSKEDEQTGYMPIPFEVAVKVFLALGQVEILRGRYTRAIGVLEYVKRVVEAETGGPGFHPCLLLVLDRLLLAERKAHRHALYPERLLRATAVWQAYGPVIDMPRVNVQGNRAIVQHQRDQECTRRLFTAIFGSASPEICRVLQESADLLSRKLPSFAPTACQPGQQPTDLRAWVLMMNLDAGMRAARVVPDAAMVRATPLRVGPLAHSAHETLNLTELADPSVSAHSTLVPTDSADDKSGRLYVWDAHEHSQRATLPASVRVVQVAVSTGKNPRRSGRSDPSPLPLQTGCLARTADGRVWASGTALALALNTSAPQLRLNAQWALLPALPAPVSRVAAGQAHFVLLLNSGAVFAAGDNSFGQLGVGDTHARSHPEQIRFENSAVKLVQVVCGTFSSHFLAADGSLWGCGRNQQFELGTSDNKQRNVPVRAAHSLPPLRFVASLGTSLLALSVEGDVFKMGGGDRVLTLGKQYPSWVPASARFVMLAARAHVTIALDTHGRVWTAGTSDRHPYECFHVCSLGTGDPRGTKQLQLVPALRNVHCVSVGCSGQADRFHYCWAVTSRGQLLSWGYGNQGWAAGRRSWLSAPDLTELDEEALEWNVLPPEARVRFYMRRALPTYTQALPAEAFHATTTTTTAAAAAADSAAAAGASSSPSSEPVVPCVALAESWSEHAGAIVTGRPGALPHPWAHSAAIVSAVRASGYRWRDMKERMDYKIDLSAHSSVLPAGETVVLDNLPIAQAQSLPEPTFTLSWDLPYVPLGDFVCGVDGRSVKVEHEGRTKGSARVRWGALLPPAWRSQRQPNEGDAKVRDFGVLLRVVRCDGISSPNTEPAFSPQVAQRSFPCRLRIRLVKSEAATGTAAGAE